MSVFRRSQANPIITRGDVPDVPPAAVDVTSVFNPAAAVVGDERVLLLRVQTRGRRTLTMVARGRDGENFIVDGDVIDMRVEGVSGTVYHIYDPRITLLDGVPHVVFAVDTDVGCRLVLFRSPDLRSFEQVALLDEPDVRNGVLFPERVGGDYLMLVRPNNVDGRGAATGDTIELRRSSDLWEWGQPQPVMSGRPHYWDELVGPGPPPVKTREGWLLVYHGVALHLASSHIYQAGVALLELGDPSSVIARGGENVLEPREPYELSGQVPNVVFPTGLIVDEADAEGFAKPGSSVRLYYGAADTCVCAAESTIAELLKACRAG